MRVLGLLVLVGALAATSAGAASPRPAALSTFAGDWWGHTRSLLITGSGRAEEVVDDGCCTRVVSLRFHLLRPRGTAADATVEFRVTTVSRWAAPHRRPRVGQIGRLRLRDGIVVDLLTGASYCNARTRPRRARLCGA